MKKKEKKKKEKEEDEMRIIAEEKEVMGEVEKVEVLMMMEMLNQ
jgi:hypothetical protein